MRISRWAGAAVVGVAAGALTLGGAAAAQEDPAFAHGQPSVTTAAGEECGTVALTFNNPTPWLQVFDVRVDGEDSLHESVAPGVEIGEGPLAGQEFGPRWRLVEVDGSADVHEVVETFAFGESVEVRLAEGAEQKLYFDWQSIDVAGMECPEEGDETGDEKKPAECVDVNTADAEQLRMLRHIDADRAAQILDLRPFTSVDDLGRINGIAAGGPRLAELVAGGDGFLPLCDIAAAGGGGGSDELPVTGAPTVLLAGGGVGLLALGGAGYLVARRRRVSFTA